MSSVFVANLNFEAENSTDNITIAQVNEGNASGRDEGESMVRPKFRESIPAPWAVFEDHGSPCFAEFFDQTNQEFPPFDFSDFPPFPGR